MNPNQSQVQGITPTSPKNKIFMYLLVVFFAVFVGTGIFLVVFNQKTGRQKANVEDNSTTMLKQEKMAIPTVAPKDGGFDLETDNDLLVKGEMADITVIADSGGKNIVGYDLVMTYDPLAFEFIDAKSLIDDYTVYSYKRSGYISITAVSKLQSQGKPFSAEEVIKLSFETKKRGKYDFSLSAAEGVDKTDMVTDQTEVLNPALGRLTIETE